MIHYRSFVLVAAAAAITLGLVGGCPGTDTGGGGGGSECDGDNPCAARDCQSVACDDGDCVYTDDCDADHCINDTCVACIEVSGDTTLVSAGRALW